MSVGKKYYCTKCERQLDGSQFYTSNNREKYPNDGKLPMCKYCLTMFVDNWDPETFVPILEMLDVPYLPFVWNDCLEKYAKDPTKVNGTTILGRYLQRMKMVQYNKLRFADAERFLAEKAAAEAITMRAAGLSSEDVKKKLEEKSTYIPEKPIAPEDTNANSPSFSFVEEEDEFESQLTDEDKMYLRLKWGKVYRAEEWVALESLYNKMMDSYDIQGAGAKDTLIMICKASLKANQCIDCGDLDGFQKMSKVYNELMKSAKLTAAQIKPESNECINSVSELVALAESEGFIPRYYVDQPQDKVDRVLQDLQGYTRSLVYDEMNLGTMIETALKEIADQKAKENKIDDDDDDAALEAQIFAEDEIQELTDADLAELRDFEDQQALEDEEFYKSLDKEV